MFPCREDEGSKVSYVLSRLGCQIIQGQAGMGRISGRELAIFPLPMKDTVGHQEDSSCASLSNDDGALYGQHVPDKF